MVGREGSLTMEEGLRELKGNKQIVIKPVERGL